MLAGSVLLAYSAWQAKPKTVIVLLWVCLRLSMHAQPTENAVARAECTELQPCLLTCSERLTGEAPVSTPQPAGKWGTAAEDGCRFCQLRKAGR